jgi:hypothetical protein
MAAKSLARGAALVLALLPTAIALAQTSGSGARNSSPTAGLRVVELAVEARAAELSLPLTEVGTVTVRACETCKPLPLLTGTRSRYLLDGEAVSLPVLRRALLAAPETGVVVLYARGRTEITRIVATSSTTPNR